jgi:ankyrin repeat protein
MSPEQIQEFYDAIRADDIYQVTQMAEAEPGLLNTMSPTGVSPLMYAIYYDKKEVANVLLVSGAPLDVFAAAALGRVDRLKALVEADAGLLATHSADGWTPLHLAAFFNKKAAVEALLGVGADIHARSTNEMANQPLHSAAAGRSREVVPLLIAAGADVNGTQAGGWTPLHGAAQSGDIETAKTLLAAGARADVRADNQQSPLDLALGRGSQELVDLLRAHGAR